MEWDNYDIPDRLWYALLVPFQYLHVTLGRIRPNISVQEHLPETVKDEVIGPLFVHTDM